MVVMMWSAEEVLSEDAVVERMDNRASFLRTFAKWDSIRPPSFLERIFFGGIGGVSVTLDVPHYTQAEYITSSRAP